jgi:hypothetical protein
MALARIGTHDVIYARIEMPRIGAWGAIVELDIGEDAAPLGSASIEFDTTPAVSFVGTIIPSAGEGSPVPGRARVLMRAGVNALLGDVAGKPYADIAPRLIVEDIIADAGENIELLSNVDSLPTQRLWVRPKGTGAQALSRFLFGSGLTWRFRPSGRVEILADSWPAYSGDATLTAAANELQRAEYALDVPDLLPGMSLDGKNCRRVVHCIRRDGTFRTEVTFQ